MGRRRRCGPDRAADREDELSECASLSRDGWGVVSNAGRNLIAIDAAMIAPLTGAVLAAFVGWTYWKTPPDEKGPPHDPR